MRMPTRSDTISCLAPDRFGTETHEGRSVIAHELTHVVQQSSADAGVHQSHEGDGFSLGSIAPAQPGVTAIQRKAKRSGASRRPNSP